MRRVQHFIIKLYNCEVETDNEEKMSDDSNDNSVQLLLESLYKTFCSLPSNGNYLLDYQINNHCNTIDKTTSFIRFLLVDGDVLSENTQLKYILTIEYNNNELSKACKSSTNEENANQTIVKKIAPIVALRSVYDDENYENYLNIDIASIIDSADKNREIHEDLAAVIKTATVNGMRQLRHKVLTPVLTRYNKLWSPSDPYFMSSLQKPQS